MKPLLALLAASALATCAWTPAPAQNAQVSGLPARGTPAASDQVPVLPVGATHLEATTVGAIAALGGGGGGFTLVNTPCNGVADDTAAIQAALNTGVSAVLPAGTCVISSGLTAELAANDGQTLRGAGSWGQPDGFNAAPPGATVIRPTSAVTTVLTIDGTPIIGGGYQVSWVQGFSVENLVIDMTNMTDAATTVAIHQIQAWDGHYSNVRVVNDGNYKRAWLLSAGAFTTTIDRPWGHIIDLEGANINYEVTTITITNPDIQRLIADWTGNVVVQGGAIQHPYTAGVTPIVWVPSGGVGPYSLGYPSTGEGLYVAEGSDIKNSQYVQIYGTDFEAASQPPATCTDAGGWSFGTYNDGTHGCAPLVMGSVIESTAFDTLVDNSAYAGGYFLDQGVGSNFLGLSQNGAYGYNVSHATAQYDLGDLRVTGTLSGPVGYKGNLGSETSSAYTISGSSGIATFKGLTVRPPSDGAYSLCVDNAAPTACELNFTTGASTGILGVVGNLDAYQVALQPATDGSVLFLKNAAGSAFMICASAATIGNSNCGVGSGADWAGYSDSGFSAQTYDLDAAGGNGRFSGLLGATGLNISSAPFAAPKLVVSATSPAYSSGFSTGTPTIAGASTGGFAVTLGATPASTGVLTMPAASVGWVCLGSDQTTAAGTIRETGSTTTSVTFALASTVASDVLNIQCMGR